MRRSVKTVVSLFTVTALVLTGCGKSKEEIAEEEKASLTTDFSVDYEGIAVSDFTAGTSVHDPSILEVDGTYYIYGSHMSAAKSTDLRTWKTITGGHGYSSENAVYGDIYDCDDAFVLTGRKTSSITTDDGTVHVWAPDVKYSEKTGKYYMYFCTSSNYYSSTVCYATSDSPEGPFEWQGNLVYSGFNTDNIDKTDVLDYVDEDYVKETYLQNEGLSYKNTEWPNAIDPTIFWDKDGKMWMTYGSWSGGIFLLEIDEETGKVIHPEADPDNNVDPYYGKRLIGGGHTSIEGPYIVYDSVSDYYYLYVSYGSLTRTGGYQIRVFRSKTPDGDYEDMNGKSPTIGSGNPSNFGLKLSGNYMLPSLSMAYMATGHNSSFIAKDGKRYIVYHTRFEKKNEYHEPRVHQYFTNEEGWPCMLPYETDGEQISETGYNKEEVIGEYYVVNQGTAVNADIAEPIKLVLTEGGNVFGKGVSGTWEQTKDSYYMHISYGEKEYSGIFCKMKDEAGTECMTFSAVGSNESIWGVKY
jgi:arabinan endo-1,5-alpha-L-arabinosidase